MIYEKLIKKTKTLWIGAGVGAVAIAVMLAGCTSETNVLHGRDGDITAVSQTVSERGGEGTESGGEGSGGEHAGGSEGSGTEGGGESGAAGGEEATANQLAPDETFDDIRGGARLILNYDNASNAFTGTVENTTRNTLTRVRIEIHLSNGTELGPTIPMDLAPGQTAPITLQSTPASFTGWIAHAEVGSAEGGGTEGAEAGGEGGGEGGAEGTGGEGGSESAGGESGGSGLELNEAAMSSPITPLDQAWKGNLGPLAIDARYDAATQSVISTVQNTTSQKVCYVQAEPHLKSGTTTVGELGPDKLGDLNPGQTVTTNVSVASEPALAGVAFDGYVVHMEVFDCAGPGPQPHPAAQGGEGGAEGAGGEGHGPGGEGAAGGEEGSSANQLAPNETFDMVRSGARLIMNYDANSNSFMGNVENTTNGVLTRVRIEVHLSNGTELGPTTPINMAPGQTVAIELPSTAAPFTGWVAHAEVGGGEGGGESGGEHGAGGSGGGEGSESGGEGSGGESGGEHGGARESGGEHGGRGEGRGGG